MAAHNLKQVCVCLCLRVSMCDSVSKSPCRLNMRRSAMGVPPYWAHRGIKGLIVSQPLCVSQQRLVRRLVLQIPSNLIYWQESLITDWQGATQEAKPLSPTMLGNERTSKKKTKKTTAFVPSVSHNVLKVGGMHLIMMSTCKMCVLELYVVLFCLI